MTEIQNRIENKEGIELLAEAIKCLELVPRTGFGEAIIKVKFANNTLMFTDDSFVLENRTRVEIKLD